MNFRDCVTIAIYEAALEFLDGSWSSVERKGVGDNQSYLLDKLQGGFGLPENQARRILTFWINQ